MSNPNPKLPVFDKTTVPLTAHREMGYFKDQRWLVAHNGWNIYGAPLNNQVLTIPELLDYGVRGFALDIYEDAFGNLVLEHNKGNLVSQLMWRDAAADLNTWLKNHPREIVTLFFESDLDRNALAKLDQSLRGIIDYQSGKKTQEDAIAQRTLASLIDGELDANGQLKVLPQRLFAFLQEEPDKNAPKQDLFPVMTSHFAENVYGDPSLDHNTWVSLRKGSGFVRPLTFMNHFGNAPTQSSADRNHRDLIKQHAGAFLYSYQGRCPNFISLDVIGEDGDRAALEAITELQSQRDLNVILPPQWNRTVDFDDVFPFLFEKEITGLLIAVSRVQGITNIRPATGPTGKHIVAVQVYSQPGRGLVNLRMQYFEQPWEAWEMDVDIPATSSDPGLITYKVPPTDELAGYCFRTKAGQGVVSFAIATRRYV